MSGCPCFCLVREERAKSQTHSFWGANLSFLIGYVDISALWGRTLDGGDIRPLGIKVSWGVSLEEGRAAHGPLHPAVIKSLETLMVFLFRICLPFGFVFGLVVWCHYSLGLEFSEVVLALQNSTPVSILFVCPLSFCNGCVSRRLFLSQVLGKHKPFSGLCFP